MLIVQHHSNQDYLFGDSCRGQWKLLVGKLVSSPRRIPLIKLFPWMFVMSDKSNTFK